MIKNLIAVAEHSEMESFCKSDHCAYQETSEVTNDLNHPSKDNVNSYSPDLLG